MTCLMLIPVASWRWRVTARAVMTMVRWASMASRAWWKTGRARRSCLLIRKDASTCHSSWWEETTSAASIRRDGTKGDVPLEPRRGTGPGDGGLVQGGVTGVDGDETGASGLLLAGDDGPSAVGLSCEGLVVPGRAALGVGPHRPPRTRVGARVPHRLGLEALVPLAPGASLGGDGVDEPPVGEGVAFPVEVGLQVAGGADLTGADDEPQSGLVQGLEVGR
mgnify:CR=1 FL=1